jgi:hypothetical protein
MHAGLPIEKRRTASLQQFWINFGWQAGSEYRVLTPTFAGWSLAKRDHGLL